MDGTLSQPNLDFALLRRRVGVPEGRDIIGHMASLRPRQQAQAQAVVESIEMEAALQAQPNPGAIETVAHLKRQGINLGLVTNNHRQAMHHTLQRLGLDFPLKLSREDGQSKPAPDLLLLALQRLGCQADEACFVGDGKYDHQASLAAGVAYIHLSHDLCPLEGVTTIFSLTQLPPLLIR
jgi:HAD superfamily hydrolase (TIGR01549 family)